MSEFFGLVQPLLPTASEAGRGDFALLSDFAIIMAVAGGAVVAFRILKQPPILGYLLAGLLIGPFTLPNPPVENVEVIRGLAELGLIILLFALGLDLGWGRLRRVGLRVIVIGTMEITLMMALGYEIGTLLGWTGREAVLLGAALSITSTAIVYKMLRDTGRLHLLPGRIIVGILIVEDFAAVILLTIFSGVATTGTAGAGDIGALALKLVLFAVSALVIVTILAPRIVRFIARYSSDEIMLLASLAMCFGLALIAQELNLSPAAGAFLVGTVLGDTRQSEQLGRLISPIRDFFAALFFISIGMLVDLSEMADRIGSAIIISAVFIAGKVLADTIGTFVTGHDGRTSLRVGTGMTQIGEFSLAIVKSGADYGAVGPFLYPIVTVATGITSLLYPFIYRTADPLAGFLERTAPRPIRQYISNTVVWIGTCRSVFQLRSEGALRVQHYSRLTLVNVGVIMILLAVGTVALRFTDDISGLIHLRESLVGLVVGGIVLALIVPPTIATWWSLRKLTDSIASYLSGGRVPLRNVYGRGLGIVLRDSLLLLLVIVLFIWSLPFLSHLLFLGSMTAPLPILFLVLLAGAGFFVSVKIYRVVAHSLSSTFLDPIIPADKAEGDRDE